MNRTHALAGTRHPFRPAVEQLEDRSVPSITTPQVDVSVTNSGQGVVPFGSRVTFTAVVSNSGPDNAPGTAFADDLPGNLFDATWTSSTSTGVTGSAGSGRGGAFGGGGISEALDLPAGASITYVIQGTFGGGGGNAVSTFAMVSAAPTVTDTDPANNTATATDTTLGTVTGSPVDVTVAVTPDQQNVTAGGWATFTFVVSNGGTSAVDDVMVSTVSPWLFGDRLTTWTSVASGGAAGSAGSGSRDVWEPVSLPAGASITYTVTMPLPGLLSAHDLTALAQVTLPPGFVAADTGSPYLEQPAHFTALAPGVTAPPPAPDAPRPFAVGTGGGVEGQVVAYNTDGSVRFALTPFPGYDGGVPVATGDVNGDGVPDIVAGAVTASDDGHIAVFDGASGRLIASFRTFARYEGGVNVAVGDVLGDGFGDVIVGSDSGGPHVTVFSLATGAPVLGASFMAFDGFSGGASVAAGDLDGDGFDELIVGAAGTGPAGVKVFDLHTLSPSRLLVASFIYQPGYTGGVNVAAGDLGGRSVFLVAPASAGAGGLVSAYDLPGARSGTAAAALAPSLPDPDTGVRVAIGAAPGGSNAVLVAPGPGHAATVLAYDLTTGLSVGNFEPFADYEGGIFVG